MNAATTTALIDAIADFARATPNRCFAGLVERIAAAERAIHSDYLSNRPPAFVSSAVRALERTQQTDRLLAVLADHLDELAWYLGPATFPKIRDRLAAAEVVGPDGAVPSCAHRLGLFAMNADTYYPRHRHGATEYYAVVGGQAEFDIDHDWTAGATGEVVNVPGGTWHAIRTTDQLMVCVYAWHGSIDFDVVYGDEAGAV